MNKNPTVIDLFSGGGGFSVGAHQAGFESILAVDYDVDITASFNDNFPNTKLLVDDLSTMEPRDLLKILGIRKGEIDGLIGGPPCQGFSLIGSRNPEDPRNTLLTRFYDYVNQLRPTFFIMENVPGLLTNDSPEFLYAGLELISHAYFVLEPIVINAADFGAATMRKRVIVIGYLPEYSDKITINDLVGLYDQRRTTVREAISDLSPIHTAKVKDDGFYWSKYTRKPKSGIEGKYSRNARKRPDRGLASKSIRQAHSKEFVSGYQPTLHTKEVINRFSKVPQGGTDKISRFPRLSWDGLCPTLRAGTGKEKGGHQSPRPLHPDEDRVITVREAARLQGFPDWFLFHPTIWHSFRMIGNSVSPYVSRALLSMLATKICDVEFVYG